MCSDWAGNTYPGGIAACNDYVKNNPGMAVIKCFLLFINHEIGKFTEAYWRINYVKLYQQ